MDGRDVGVVELGEQLRLALEARQPLRVLGEGSRQELEGHIAVEAGVAGPPDLAHASSAELLGDLVVAQRLAGHQRLH